MGRQRNRHGWRGELPRHRGREHQAASGSLRLPGWAWCHRAGLRPAVELGLRHRPSLFLMSCSFTNQVLAQLDLLNNTKTKAYKNDVYLLPKVLDEKVAALHLPHCGARLTVLSDKQAEYIGCK